MHGDGPSIDWDRWLAACATGLSALQRQLAETPLPVAALIAAAAAPEDGEPYGRRPLHRGATGEVLLVGWREDMFCAPHDHGPAAGFVTLLQGRFVERRWRWEPGGLALDGERALAAPAIIPVRAHEIHSMKATDGGVGVHFYLPAITGMRVYDCERRETLVVGDDCGAWVPADTTLVQKRTAW